MEQTFASIKFQRIPISKAVLMRIFNDVFFPQYRP